ncbi:MS18A protein, partial [Polyodon spathula]|nr:protein Mis18-alpha [Polyodon spathula]MBN3284074.1 MS18A protein [Polyodon spathula]
MDSPKKIYAEHELEDESGTLLGISQEGVGDCEENGGPPAVFLCVNCKVPIGDSLAWLGSEDETGTIWLKTTTNNVVVSNEKLVSTKLNECDCIYSLLSCGGCYCELGKIYTCTPKNLDYKRDVFCLNVMSVASYVLGSTPHKALADEDDEPITVESRIFVETDIQRIKSVLMTLEERLCALESNFLPKGQ